MSIVRDGFPDVHPSGGPLDDLDALALDPEWDGDALDDLLADLAAGPAAPCEPRLPFPEWVAAQAAWFRSQGTPAADWVAGELEDLAAMARGFGSENPDQFDSRRRQREESDRQDLIAEGFSRGVRHADPAWRYVN